MDLLRSTGCSTITPVNNTSSGFNTQSNPPILLLRGEICPFGIKAKHAQNSGYQGVVIIHSSSERDISNIAVQNIFVDNDIHIPLIIVSNADGTKLQQHLIDRTQRKADSDVSEAVIINIQIDNSPLSNLDVKFFYSSDDVEFYEFFKEYYPLKDSLAPYLNFSFHVVTHPNQEESQKKAHCVSNGKYCSPLVKNKRIKGKDIVLIDLFHQCVYNQYGFKNFLEYIKAFNLNCYWYAPKFTKECVKDTLTEINLLYSKIENCVAASFGSQVLTEQTIGKDNNVLAKEYTIKKKYDAKGHPIVYINNHLLDKRFSINTFIDSVCSKLNKRPDYCEMYFASLKSRGSFGMGFVYLLIFVVLIINISIYIICRKYLLNKIKERLEGDTIDIDGRINNAVSKYFSMKETSVEMK